MVATTLAADPSSTFPLSDTAAGDLVLRICNSARDGQLVRLRSAKCTVGSGPRCTLRLRARGVAPLHCLIVRGPAAAAVQRWSVDTRLNHRAFVDAPLSPGDRLSIGPIELEVVSLGIDAMPAAEGFREPSATEAQPQPSNEISDSHREMQSQIEAQRLELDELADRLQQREASLNLQAEQLAARLDELQSDRQTIQEQHDRWLAEQRQSNDDFAQERQQLAVRLADVETQEHALAEERRQWEAMRQETADHSSVEAEQLNARLAEIDSQRRAFEEDRQQWTCEREQAERRLAEEDEKFASAQSELRAAQDSLAAERRQWQADRDGAAGTAAVENQQLSLRLAAIEEQSRALENQRRQWDAGQEEAKQRLAQQRDELSARLADLADQEARLAHEREQWEAIRQETADQSSVEAERLNARLTEIDNVRRAFEEERQQWLGEQEEAERRLAEEREKFASAQAELRADRDSLAAERRQWQSEREAFENDQAAAMADLETQRAALEAERRQWEADRDRPAPLADEPPADAQSAAKAGLLDESAVAEPEFQAPTERSPVDLSEVFRRIGAKVDLAEDEPAGDTSPITSQGVDSGPATPSAAPSEPPLAAQVVPNSANDGAEESIDDYMSRLMQRVRSSDGGSSQATYAPTGRPEPSRAEAAPTDLSGSGSPLPSIATSMDKPSAPAEMQRRAVAPEKRIDLSTLREVANLSANSALSQHSRRVLIDTMYSKLSIAAVALLASVALFWFWTTSSGLEVTFYSALVAVLVAIYWGVEYALLTGRLIVSKGHINIDWSAFARRKKAKTPDHNAAAEDAGTPNSAEATLPTVDSLSRSEDWALAELAADGDELADVHGEMAAQQQ